jgi:UDP-N-acetylmuramoylalanine--D-glutamate ligase
MSNELNDKARSLAGKHVIVLGIARQGKALARWLPTQGATVTLSDRRNAGQLADDLLEFLGDSYVNYALGGHPVELLNEADMLCISGGVPVNIPIVQEAFRRRIPVKNDAVLFLERCPATVIGVTGSAGKTTTTTLVGEIGKRARRKTWVGGNIGNVLLDNLGEIQADDLVVMELSSFQLEIAGISPSVAALLNVTPNHLDRHGTLEAYAEAKANIFMHQKADDVLVYGRDDMLASTMGDLAPGRTASFSTLSMVGDGACMVGRRLMLMGNCSPTGMAKVIVERPAVKLRGEHNLANILAACALAGAAQLPVEAMQEAIVDFKGVPHRLEVVAEMEGVRWINDSIATSPERVIAAVKSFDEPLILLLGGKDKDLPWDELIRLAVKRCKAVICFGEFGPTIADYLEKASRYTPDRQLKTIETVRLLHEAVSIARRIAESGDVVLLSPGGTSFDQYKDFEARGVHFRNLVRRSRGKR